MKTFEEKYPNFVSPHKCRVIKLSEHSWRWNGIVPDFKRNYICLMRDDSNFINWNISPGLKHSITISNILNKFYNQHL
jgi:hypothetical protein